MITSHPSTPDTQSTLAADFPYQVARNKVPGAQIKNVFAFSATVGTTINTLWDATPTAYAFPTSAVVMTIASTSASDNTACKVTVNGLDSGFNPLVETVTLNGVTNVTTTGSFLRVNSVDVVSPGTGQVTNIGTITVKNGGTTYAQINPTIGRTQQAYYTVPNGYTFYLTAIHSFSGDAGLGTNYVSFQVKVRDNDLATPVTRLLTESNFLGAYQVNRTVPLLYGQKNDIEWQISVHAGVQSVSLIAMGILIANTAA
jgi:hypothetical protein